MRFRLTYRGTLKSNKKCISGHKHEIRRVFHRQLKELWHTDEFLKAILESGELYGRDPLYKSFGGHTFVPLVRAGWFLNCSLEILVLGRANRVIRTGDIDNRIKTLIDALKMPADAQDIKNAQPNDDENPFFILLEDDKQVTRFSAEVDILLDTAQTGVDVLISVDVRPYLVTMSTMSFGSS